jgi:hypothetical protein
MECNFDELVDNIDDNGCRRRSAWKCTSNEGIKNVNYEAYHANDGDTECANFYGYPNLASVRLLC